MHASDVREIELERAGRVPADADLAAVEWNAAPQSRRLQNLEVDRRFRLLPVCEFQKSHDAPRIDFCREPHHHPSGLSASLGWRCSRHAFYGGEFEARRLNRPGERQSLVGLTTLS